MTRWKEIGRDHRNLRPWTDIGLKWAGKYYSKMNDTRAYVVVMCRFLFSFPPPLANVLSEVLNPCIQFTWIDREWDDYYRAEAKRAILEVVCLP